MTIIARAGGHNVVSTRDYLRVTIEVWEGGEWRTRIYYLIGA